MRSKGLKGLVGVVAAGSFLLSSTAATASQTASLPDPLAVLSVMSGGAPAAVLCGAAAAATAQGAAPGCVLPVADAPVAAVEAPPAPVPVPAVEPVGGGFAFNPLLLGLGALALGIGAFVLLRGDKDNDDDPVSG